MKKFSKILSVALLVALVLSLGVASAFAATYADGDGSITVNNAIKGQTYYAIKVLSATVSDDGIAYSGTIPSELSSVLEVKEIVDGSRKYQAIGEVTPFDQATYDAAMKAFAVAHKNEAVPAAGILCEGNSVQFTDLDLGFYVIFSTLNGEMTPKVSAGSTFGTGAAGTVYEKNETTVTVHKDGDVSYSIGDTVTYTVTFNGVNYVGSGADAQIIVEYEVIDTLPAFLSGAAVTSVKVGGTEIISTLDVSTFASEKHFFIPWADGNHDDGYTSKYANGTSIEITYTATLTDIVKVDGQKGEDGATGQGNINTVTIKPYIDTPEGPGPDEREWSDDHEIFTYAAALKKTDGTKALAGAKFKFYGLTVTETAAGVYTVDSYNPNAYATGDNATQDETKLGTEMVVGTDGKLYIVGLKEGVTLHGVETEAPSGYNKLTTEVTVTPQILNKTIYKSNGYEKYDEKGNVIERSETSSEEFVEVKKNLDELDAAAVEVINKSGTTLPSTGGIGTTIFYVVGGVLVLAAIILLVTKKRMSE